MPPPAAGLTWRMGWMGRAPGTLDFVGRLRQTAAVGEGLTSTLAALGLQRCSGAMPPPGHAFLAGSLLPAHSSPRRAGRECAGIAKTTPLRLSLTPGRPPNLGHQSLFLVWPTQTEFTRHRLRLEMDAACCSGHRRTERRKNGEKKVRWLCTGTGTWPVNCGCDALDATADGSISLSSFLSSLVRQNTPNLGPSHRAFEVGLPRSAVRRGQGVPWVAH